MVLFLLIMDVDATRCLSVSLYVFVCLRHTNRIIHAHTTTDCFLLLLSMYCSPFILFSVCVCLHVSLWNGFIWGIILVISFPSSSNDGFKRKVVIAFPYIHTYSMFSVCFKKVCMILPEVNKIKLLETSQLWKLEFDFYSNQFIKKNIKYYLCI